MSSKKVFWNWFKKDVQGRWKKHHFEWIEVCDWHWRLDKFDTDTLAEAVRQHKACDDWRVPSLKKVYDYAKTIKADNSPKQQPDESRRNMPPEHTFIMCVAKSANGRGAVGRFLPILLWPFKTQWTPDDYRRVAEEQCIMYSRNGRNGVWKAFYNTTHFEMLDRRWDLLGVKPLDLNQLRKLYKTPKP